MLLSDTQTPLFLLQLVGLALPAFVLVSQIRMECAANPRTDAWRVQSVQLNFYCLLYAGVLLFSGLVTQLRAMYSPWLTVLAILLLAFSSGTLVGSLRTKDD